MGLHQTPSLHVFYRIQFRQSGSSKAVGVALMGATTPYPYHCLARVILIVGFPLCYGSGW